MHTRLLSTRCPDSLHRGGKAYIFLGETWAFAFFVQGIHHLQQLAADEVGPAADLGGNTVNAGELLVHALSEELCSLLRYC